MISILKTANELDRIDELRATASECYQLAMRSAAQYAVEFDSQRLAEFRMHLGAMEEMWSAAETPDAMRGVEASLRGELREYRDQSRQHLARLRKEVEGAAHAMASFAEGIAANGADYDERVKKELHGLARASESEDMEAIRGTIRSAVGEISAGVEQMRRSNQLIIAQLQDEIRLLHQEFEAERRTLFTDAASGAWTRQKMEQKMQTLLRAGDVFCAVVVAIPNLPEVQQRFSTTLVEGALKALLMRCRGMLGDDLLIARWSEDVFVTIVEVDGAAGGAIAGELAKKLGGPYSAQENGLAHSVALKIATGAVERARGAEPALFLRKLEQMAVGLARGPI